MTQTITINKELIQEAFEELVSIYSYNDGAQITTEVSSDIGDNGEIYHFCAIDPVKSMANDRPSISLSGRTILGLSDLFSHHGYAVNVYNDRMEMDVETGNIVTLFALAQMMKEEVQEMDQELRNSRSQSHPAATPSPRT